MGRPKALCGFCLIETAQADLSSFAAICGTAIRSKKHFEKIITANLNLFKNWKLVGHERMNKKEAFTLVELVLTVALLSILTGTATAVFIQSFRERSVDYAAKEVTFFLRYVQFKAIEEGRTHKLTFDSVSGEFKSFVEQPKPAGFQEILIPFANRFKNHGPFLFRLEQGNALYFFPDGSVTPNQLIISEENQEKASIGIKNRLGLFEVVRRG